MGGKGVEGEGRESSGSAPLGGGSSSSSKNTSRPRKQRERHAQGIGHQLPQAPTQGARQHAQVQGRGLGVSVRANHQLPNGRVQPHANTPIHKLAQRCGAQAAVHGQEALRAVHVPKHAKEAQRLGLCSLPCQRLAQLILQLQPHLHGVQGEGGSLARARRNAAQEPPCNEDLVRVPHSNKVLCEYTAGEE